MSLLKKEIMVPTIIVLVSALLGFSFGYLALHPQIATLNTTLTTTQAQLESLDTSLATAQEADISASLDDERLESSYFHSVQGLVINFGSEPAVNIVITVKWFNEGTSYHQEIITIPSLDGRAIKEINFSYAFEGRADDLQYTVSWE